MKQTKVQHVFSFSKKSDVLVVLKFINFIINLSIVVYIINFIIRKLNFFITFNDNLFVVVFFFHNIINSIVYFHRDVKIHVRLNFIVNERKTRLIRFVIFDDKKYLITQCFWLQIVWIKLINYLNTCVQIFKYDSSFFVRRVFRLMSRNNV